MTGSTNSLIKLLAGIFGVVGGVAAVFAAVGALVLMVQHRFGFDLRKIGAEERGHEGTE